MKKRRKKRFAFPVIGGFLALYFVIMILATFLVKEKFMEDFARNYETRLGRMIQDIGEFEQELWETARTNASDAAGEGAQQDASSDVPEITQDGTTGVFEYGNYKVLRDTYSGEVRATQYQAYLSKNLNLLDTKYQQFSGAVYNGEEDLTAESGSNEKKELMAKSGNKVSLANGFTQNIGKYVLEYSLDELLTPEELRTLVKYAEEAENFSGEEQPGPYRISVLVMESEQDEAADLRVSQGWELYRIVVQRIVWEVGNGEAAQEDPLSGSYHSWQDTGGESYQQVDNEIVWEWKNPDIEDEPRTEYIPLSIWEAFPYLQYGYDCWLRWTQSEYLHDFPEALDPEKWKDGGVISSVSEDFTAQFGSKYTLDLGTVSEERDGELHLFKRKLFLVLLSESHPWLAAIDYMKYAYLGSFLFLIICTVIMVFVIGKMYEKRALLEEKRRDFTNAMAHELKTPLGIIRGMAENLQEHTAPEKTDYYIRHIIGQTEEMDHLVAEMIYTSKLDSEAFVLKKEPLRWKELLESQLEKFAPVIEEKHIHIRYEENGTVYEGAYKAEQETPEQRKNAGSDLEGDRGCMEKAVWNLLSNAVHWCRPEGTVTIALGKGFCSIENTGPEISQEHLPHIFEMLYHGEDGNQGMGLYLTKRIAEMHGMKVTVENTGEGVRSRIG